MPEQVQLLSKGDPFAGRTHQIAQERRQGFGQGTDADILLQFRHPVDGIQRVINEVGINLDLQGGDLAVLFGVGFGHRLFHQPLNADRHLIDGRAHLGKADEQLFQLRVGRQVVFRYAGQPVPQSVGGDGDIPGADSDADQGQQQRSQQDQTQHGRNLHPLLPGRRDLHDAGYGEVAVRDAGTIHRIQPAAAAGKPGPP